MLGRFLNGPIGFAWGIRISAFICVACLAVANLLMRTNSLAGKPKPNSSSLMAAPLNKMILTPAYITFILFAFLTSLAVYNPMFSIELFAREDVRVSTTLGSYLLAIINLTSTFGRTIPNYLADRYGVFLVYIPCTAAAGKFIYR